MKFLAPFVAFNILVIPALIYCHMQDECKLLQPYLGTAFPDFCGYVNNIWLNIVAANAVLILVGLLAASPQGGGAPSGRSSSRPSGGGGSHGKGH
jgi:hypothetical protein